MKAAFLMQAERMLFLLFILMSHLGMALERSKERVVKLTATNILCILNIDNT